MTLFAIILGAMLVGALLGAALTLFALACLDQADHNHDQPPRHWPE